MSLTQLSDRIYAFDLGATLIGVLKSNDAATLIDTGISKQQAKKIDKAVGLPVVTVLHTHFHADHIGGTAYFAEHYNAQAYIPSSELSFALQPELNPSLLYGGYVPEVYRQPFLYAEPFPVKPLPPFAFIDNSFMIASVDTKGHTIGHTAYLIDDILFLGDSVTSPDVIDKHGLLYTYNPLESYNTLECLRSMDFEKAVLCHKDIIDKKQLIEYTDVQKYHIEKIEHDILCIVDGNTVEEIASELMDRLNVEVTPVSWLLALSTVKGYMVNLETASLAECRFVDRALRWSKTGVGSAFSAVMNTGTDNLPF